MKTLDEVIEAMDHVEFCCTNCKLQFDCDEVECFLEDALFYLKEYRWIQENCADTLAEKYPSENVPLNWDELKQMEGKPVWVDPLSTKALHTPGWGLVGKTSFTTWAGVECCSIVKVGVTYALPVGEYGKTWQAYRKARS